MRAAAVGGTDGWVSRLLRRIVRTLMRRLIRAVDGVIVTTAGVTAAVATNRVG